MSGDIESGDGFAGRSDSGPDPDAYLDGVCWPTLNAQLRKSAALALSVAACALCFEYLPEGGFSKVSLITTGSTAGEGASATPLDAEQIERERHERDAHWRMVNELAREKQRSESEGDADAEERLVKSARGQLGAAPPDARVRPSR